MEGQVFPCGEIGTVQPDGIRGGIVRVSGGGNAVDNAVEPLSPLVFQIEVQLRQPCGVGGVIVKVQPQVGGIDLRLRQRYGLAVQQEGLSHINNRPLLRVGGVEAQFKGKGGQNLPLLLRVIGQQLVTVVGHAGLRRGRLVLIEMFVVINAEGHGQAVRHVPVHKVDPEVDEITVFHTVAAERCAVSLLLPRHRQLWVL